MKKISNGVYAFELEMERLGQTSTIYPLLIFDGDTSAMIDAGLPTSIPEIEAQLGEVELGDLFRYRCLYSDPSRS